MSCQRKLHPIVLNVNVRVVIHPLSLRRHSINESDTLHEVFEHVELGYAHASKLPALYLPQLCFDLSLLEPQLSDLAFGLLLRLDLGVNVVGLQSSASNLLIDLPQQ